MARSQVGTATSYGGMLVQNQLSNWSVPPIRIEAFCDKVLSLDSAINTLT